MTKIGIAIFAAAVLSGPLYGTAEYSAVSNLISELGAQQTRNNFIMIAAFLALGISVAVDGLKNFHRTLVPFICFGIAMVMAGAFPHKPMGQALVYDQTIHMLHGLSATIAGIAITIGLVWRGLTVELLPRMTCFYMALVAMVFPLLMLEYPHYQGIIQRLMYIQLLGWLWFNYPTAWLNIHSADPAQSHRAP